MKKQSGISVLQLILIIVLGILIASFIERVASLMLIGTVIKGFDNAIKQNLPNDRYNKRIYTPSTYQSPAIQSIPIQSAPKNYIQNREAKQLIDDRPALLKIKEDYTLPITKAFIKPLTDSMAYQQKRNLEKYKIESEFRRLYKPTIQCIRPENEVMKGKCDDVYKTALAKFTKEKEEKEHPVSGKSYMKIEKGTVK